MENQVTYIGVGLVKTVVAAACMLAAAGAEASPLTVSGLPSDAAGSCVCEYRRGVMLKRLVLEEPRRMVAYVAVCACAMWRGSSSGLFM